MAGSPYVPDAKKYDPKDFERVAGEPLDPDAASWGMQPDGSFLPPAETPSVPRDVFIDWPGQLPYRDPETYSLNATAEAFYPIVVNTSHSWQAIYNWEGRRYMLHYGGGNRWNVYDITDPRDLVVVAEETLPWTGPGFGAVTIQWNEKLGKHIAIQASETPRYFLKGRVANKWTDPTVEGQLLEWEGLRGFRVFEVNGPTPHDWTLLTEVSTDPNHGPDEVQEGNGVLDLPVYYGDQYLFVATAPDNTFINQPYRTTLWTAGHAAYDVSDPANPVHLSTWWVPGSRKGEEEDSPYLAENARWNNKTSWFGSRMGIFMPRAVESGWRYGYAAQGGQGFFVLDVSDPANIHHVGWCDLPVSVAGTEGDNVDTTQVEETGYVYVSGYPMNTDCYEPAKEIYQIDVSDPTQPRVVRTMPRPMPPAEAAFTDWAQRRGSFGPKRSGYFINTGTPHGKIIPYAFYAAGLQIFDVRDPEDPKVGAYFVPPMGLKDDDDLAAPVHGIFVEWDRNLIWLFANHGIYAVSTPLLGEPVIGLAEAGASATG
ncbi:LVIVD repeat-containing protein [Lysobacter korlensis]|uniref:LVIVD repeat-containing protein n=1 Tax=Lysobacter korlensis TaxID=553636 RepID=A0ABV6RXI5_9GAMM